MAKLTDLPTEIIQIIICTMLKAEVAYTPDFQSIEQYRQVSQTKVDNIWHFMLASRRFLDIGRDMTETYGNTLGKEEMNDLQMAVSFADMEVAEAEMRAAGVEFGGRT